MLFTSSFVILLLPKSTKSSPRPLVGFQAGSQLYFFSPILSPKFPYSPLCRSQSLAVPRLSLWKEATLNSEFLFTILITRHWKAARAETRKLRSAKTGNDASVIKITYALRTCGYCMVLAFDEIKIIETSVARSHRFSVRRSFVWRKIKLHKIV